MAESTDTDNANGSSSGHVCPDYPAVDTNAGAHQGRRDLELHVIWELDHEAGISNNTRVSSVGKSLAILHLRNHVLSPATVGSQPLHQGAIAVNW